MIKRVFPILLICAIFCLFPTRTPASEPSGSSVLSESSESSEPLESLEQTEEVEESLLEEISFEDVERELASYELPEDISFTDLLQSLLRDKDVQGKEAWIRQACSYVFSEWRSFRDILVQILLLTIAFSFLNHFVNLFENSQISRTSFYLCFMILMVLLMKAFAGLSNVLSDAAGRITGFMEALLPAFCMTMVFSSANMTAASFYQITLTVIYLVERILLYVVLPWIHIYVVLQMLNHMTGGRMISRITLLMRKGIRWVLRALLAGVTGINLVEHILAPSADNLQKLSVTKTLGMIPGIGGSAEAVSSILIGSAAVIRNGVGAAALVILLCISMLPFLKLLVFAVFYKIAGAVIQPFADRRVSGCVESVGDGAGLLCRTLGTGILMFMISIAVVLTAVR